MVILIAIGLVACGAPADSGGAEGSDQGGASAAGSDAALDDDVAIANYSIGFTMADNLVSNFSASVDEEAFIRGIQDRFAGRERAVSMEASRAALAAVAEQQRAAVAAQGEENLAAGEAFLTENAKREGVTQLPSGLQYEVLVTGEGKTPGPTDTVTTHYHGTLIDGTVFDSSYERGEPASFPVNGVIEGWTEALQLMPVGSKWRLYIPPDLAYGAQERGPIPPNSTLIFDVELLGIEGDESSDADAGSDDAS
jgi:FKBP-type peptidyl-prolyl cis-trans isomerase FklB